MTFLSGMTGFARVSGEAAGEHWTWEARSVNGKGLDLRLRLPSEFSDIEPAIKKSFSRLFTRGNIQISLTLQSGQSGSNYVIDEALYETISAFIKSKKVSPKVSQIMQISGVVSEAPQGRSEAAHKEIEAALTATAAQLAKNLQEFRQTEGKALLPLLTAANEKIAALTADAEKIASEQPEKLSGHLRTKLTELLGEDLPQDRLTQEAAQLALKADVREETDRLRAHCEQARELLSLGSPVGRKLDFLCQEFNREVNTLCAKSSDIDLTRIGIEMKSTVEQFREQAANVE